MPRSTKNRRHTGSGNIIDSWFNQLFGKPQKKTYARSERQNQVLWNQTLDSPLPEADNVLSENPFRRRSSHSFHYRHKAGIFEGMAKVISQFFTTFLQRVARFPRRKSRSHRSHVAQRKISHILPESTDVQVSLPRKHLPKRRKRSSNSAEKSVRTIWLYLPKQWQPMWENFLYSIYLRDMPYDPFLSPEHKLTKPKASARFLEEAGFSLGAMVVFIASGLLAWLLYQLAVVFVASFFDIDSVLYYYEVMFPIGNVSSKWNSFNIIVITLAGPLFSLIAGIFTYFYLIRRKVVRGYNRLFFLWLSFHLFNQFFGGFVAGVITDQGFGYVANWMYMGMLLKFLFSLIFLSVLAFAGFYIVPWLLATAGKPHRINPENRVVFILSQVVAPWLLGSLFLLILRLPNRPPQHSNILVYDAIIAGAMGVMAIGMFFNRQARPATVSHRKTNYRLGLMWTLITLAVVLIFRLGLSYGLHIVLQISIRLGLYNV